jgi:hypothetical protein
MTIKRPRLRMLGRQAMVAAGCLVFATGTVRAMVPSEYGIRSMVVDPSTTSAPRRVYAILSVQMVSSDPQNMPPVDEDSLMTHVRHGLENHGFRQVIKGQTPEILITVHYGRAWLRNPYLYDTGDSQSLEGISGVPAVANMPAMLGRPTTENAGITTKYLDGISRNHEALVQKAAAEKLYVRVTGWRYPTDPKAKAQMLWKTTMLVDDPDSWNLNAVAGGMLEAGAPYFDHSIAEKELEIHPPVPDGKVNVGKPERVESGPAKVTPATAPPAVAERGPVDSGKKFDLPAGDAATTLQVFSQQSGEEIIYPMEKVRGIRTNEVHGEMSARAALDRMLDGTGLSAVQDEKSEALAVRPASRR